MTRKTHEGEGSPAWLAIVRQKVGTLQFGVVQIVVHDSKVVQIERTEKTRLESPCSCYMPGGAAGPQV
jgi:hypothetical protein